MPSVLISCLAGGRGRHATCKKVPAGSLDSLIPASRQQKWAHTADTEMGSGNLFLKHFYADPGPACCQQPCSLHDNSGPRCGEKPKIPHITGTPARQVRALKETGSECASTGKKLKKRTQGLKQNLICKSSRCQQQSPLRNLLFGIYQWWGQGRKGSQCWRSETITQPVGSLWIPKSGTPGDNSLVGR